ncbi:hypothetical protein CYMTET_53191 [Cymbomonas tetramitiformis]|uniref:Uncharacterized protein n=1 Tax=Cymbomonas tetramitiformis TaxID=36881 RepID=A0AAE0BIM2_9CHLO|nr:hypothetical protein CYMTET_53191 [Cymbomonas tetramitiformis]
MAPKTFSKSKGKGKAPEVSSDLVTCQFVKPNGHVCANIIKAGGHVDRCGYHTPECLAKKQAAREKARALKVKKQKGYSSDEPVSEQDCDKDDGGETSKSGKQKGKSKKRSEIEPDSDDSSDSSDKTDNNDNTDSEPETDISKMGFSKLLDFLEANFSKELATYNWDICEDAVMDAVDEAEQKADEEKQTVVEAQQKAQRKLAILKWDKLVADYSARDRFIQRMNFESITEYLWNNHHKDLLEYCEDQFSRKEQWRLTYKHTEANQKIAILKWQNLALNYSFRDLLGTSDIASSSDNFTDRDLETEFQSKLSLSETRGELLKSQIAPQPSVDSTGSLDSQDLC